MIPGIDVPEYYVQSIHIDTTPKIGKKVVGEVSSNFNMGDPTLVESPEGFRCHSIIELELFEEGSAPWQIDDDETPGTFGEIKVEAEIFVSGSHDQFDEYYETWINGSYNSVDKIFRHHLESGILQNIISPIGALFSNSYSGIVPRIAFTPPEATAQRY